MAADKKNAYRELLELGKAKGKLSTQEILDTLDENGYTPATENAFKKLYK